MKDFDPKIKVVSFGDSLQILLPNEIPNFQEGHIDSPLYPKVKEYSDDVSVIKKERFEELIEAKRWKEAMESFGIEGWDKYREALSFLEKSKNA
jgi:hypothetical protein